MPYPETSPDATITHQEVRVQRYFRCVDREDAKKHPKQTVQGFDFYMNLGGYL